MSKKSRQQPQKDLKTTKRLLAVLKAKTLSIEDAVHQNKIYSGFINLLHCSVYKILASVLGRIGVD